VGDESMILFSKLKMGGNLGSHFLVF